MLADVNVVNVVNQMVKSTYLVVNTNPFLVKRGVGWIILGLSHHSLLSGRTNIHLQIVLTFKRATGF